MVSQFLDMLSYVELWVGPEKAASPGQSEGLVEVPSSKRDFSRRAAQKYMRTCNVYHLRATHGPMCICIPAAMFKG